MIKEIFKDIPGYEDYQVSNMGRIKSTKYRKERILKQSDNSTSKYLYITLSKGGKCVVEKIHRLVLRTFVGKPNGLICNHIDCNKQNNRLENLEYCTYKQNSQHSRRNGRHKEADKRLRKKVSQFTKKGKLVNFFNSITEASKKTGVCLQNISFCCYSRNGTAGGFKWEFYN